MAYSKELRKVSKDMYMYHNVDKKVSSTCRPVNSYRLEFKVNGENIGYIPKDLISETHRKIRGIIAADVNTMPEGEHCVGINIIDDSYMYILEVYKESEDDYRIEYVMNEHVIVSEEKLKSLFGVG